MVNPPIVNLASTSMFLKYQIENPTFKNLTSPKLQSIYKPVSRKTASSFTLNENEHVVFSTAGPLLDLATVNLKPMDTYSQQGVFVKMRIKPSYGVTKKGSTIKDIPQPKVILCQS